MSRGKEKKSTMQNQNNYRGVHINPEYCLENNTELLLGPKVERGSLTWQTKQIIIHA
jgi:hypothetical protein